MVRGRLADTTVSLAAETPPRQPDRTGKEWGRCVCGGGDPRGAGAEDLSVILRQDAGGPSPPVSCLLFIRPMEMRARSPGSGSDVVINPEVANDALAFHLNIYLHLNRHGGRPSLPHPPRWGGAQ